MLNILVDGSNGFGYPLTDEPKRFVREIPSYNPGLTLELVSIKVAP